MSSTRIAILVAFISAYAIPSQVQAEILIDCQPAQNLGLSAQTQYNCHFSDANAVLHWSCGPFTHSHPLQTRTNASLSAVVIGGAGSVDATPSSVSDQTHYSSGNENANVAMTMGGTGIVNVIVSVAIDENSAVAGNHDTTVLLTVTSFLSGFCNETLIASE